MAVYTHLSQEQLAQVAQRYGFASLRRAQGIADGVENSNFLIEGEREGQPLRAILTLFEKRVCADELPFFIALMQHLAKQHVPCPVPLLQADGQALSEHDGKPLCMVSFLQGQSIIAPNVAHCRQLGAAMAKLHLAGQDAPLRRRNDLSLQGWQALYDKIRGGLDDVSQGLGPQLAQELIYLTQHWPSNLPRGMIHADLFPDNVFFDEAGQLSGIIDFYFACEDFLAYDLAICLNCWCFDAGIYNAEKARAMMEGYASVRALGQAEHDALPVLLRGAALRFLLTRAHDVIFHDAAAIVSPHDPMEYAAKLKWWQTQ